MTFKQLINSILGPILGSIFGIEVSIKNPREAIKFAKIYFKLNPITAIEVGVFEGENAKSILKNLNIDRIFLIDPYKKYDDYKKEGNCINIVKAKQKAFKRLKRFSNKIIWILDYSSNASKEIKRKVDFVYIDGNHKYKYVKDDLENYLQSYFESSFEIKIKDFKIKKNKLGEKEILIDFESNIPN